MVKVMLHQSNIRRIIRKLQGNKRSDNTDLYFGNNQPMYESIE